MIFTMIRRRTQEGELKNRKIAINRESDRNKTYEAGEQPQRIEN
jgi:hypothetical protein